LREPGEGGEKGWFCRVERFWWTRKEKLVGLGFDVEEVVEKAPEVDAVPEPAGAVAALPPAVVEEEKKEEGPLEQEGEKDVVMP